MKAFVEVETPEYCDLAEAVDWISFGDVPSTHMVEEKDPVSSERIWVDVRRSQDALYGELSVQFGPISLRHFQAHGIGWPMVFFHDI